MLLYLLGTNPLASFPVRNEASVSAQPGTGENCPVPAAIIYVPLRSGYTRRTREPVSPEQTGLEIENAELKTPNPDLFC